MTNAECMKWAAVIGEAGRSELPAGAYVFVTVFDADDGAAAYGTGPFERTKDVLRDFATAGPIGPTVEA